MSEAARHRMSVREFYSWLRREQPEGRFDLVDGEIVAMAGANRRHDRIVTTALRLVGVALEGQRCQPFSSDTYISIPTGNRRQPDMGVDCGSPDDDSLDAGEPILVVEVLSPTTRAFDLTEKVEEYKTVESLEFIILVDPDWPQVRVHYREPDRNWSSYRLAGLDSVLNLPRLCMKLSLGDLYSGLTFRPRPVFLETDASI